MNAGAILPAENAHSGMPRLVSRIAILAWAGFWSWFVVVDGLEDARTLGQSTYLIMLAILAGLWIPTVVAWRHARAGAVCMAIAGAAALWFFPGAFARGVLAGPPLLFAAVLAWIASRERRGRRQPGETG